MDLGLTRAQKIHCVSGEVVSVYKSQLKSESCKGHTEEGHPNTVTQGVV